MTVGTALLLLVLGVLTLAALAAASGAALRAVGRLERRRTVLARVSAARAWSLVGDLPTLISRHAKLLDRGDLDEWELRSGDGTTAGSVWLGRGHRNGRPYWLEVQIVRCEAGAEMSLRLRRDALGTHLGLRNHCTALSVAGIDARATKLTLRLHARMRGLRLIWLRLVSPAELQARLLDHGLRSVKLALEARAQTAAAGAPRRATSGAIAPGRDLRPRPRPGRPPQPRP
ncbi:MAG: hypothetical protein ACE5JH_02705 [Acidobacteriota bacterium]